jgi:hypothetical protein
MSKMSKMSRRSKSSRKPDSLTRPNWSKRSRKQGSLMSLLTRTNLEVKRLDWTSRVNLHSSRILWSLTVAAAAAAAAVAAAVGRLRLGRPMPTTMENSFG